MALLNGVGMERFFFLLDFFADFIVTGAGGAMEKVVGAVGAVGAAGATGVATRRASMALRNGVGTERFNFFFIEDFFFLALCRLFLELVFKLCDVEFSRSWAAMDGTYSKRKERSPTVNISPSRRRWALSVADKWLDLLMIVGLVLDNVLREAVKAPPF